VIFRAQDYQFVARSGRLAADPLTEVHERTFEMRIVRLSRDPNRTAHRHPASPEVIYVVRGSGRVWMDGRSERVAPGDTVLVPAGSAHATVPDEDVEMELVCFWPHPDLGSNIEELDVAPF
jgi:quercetin dioxygenase-like cupin family protein